MRHHATPELPNDPHAPRGDWTTLRRLLPYLWHYKWRVMAALAFMVGAKLANVGVPLLLKELIDALTPQPSGAQMLMVVPLALLLGYGLLRLSVSAFTELRELVFAAATQGAARKIALQTFEHLHNLSLRFHLERQTGGMSRDIERGVRGIESLIAYSLYSIVPTLIEVVLVLTILGMKFDKWYAIITLTALALYIYFTVTVTEWRTQFRKQVNEFDSSAHTRAIDSLLNYETVKYFGNEAFEAKRYDENLNKLRQARINAQNSLSALNIGQQLIIAVALVAMTGVIALEGGLWVLAAVILSAGLFGGWSGTWRRGLGWLLCAAIAAGVLVWRQARRQNFERLMSNVGGANLSVRLMEDSDGAERFWWAKARVIEGPHHGAKVLWQGRGEMHVAGSMLQAAGNFQALADPRNPGEFDRAQWLRNPHSLEPGVIPRLASF